MSRPPKSPLRSRFIPRLEVLEDRSLPSVLVPSFNSPDAFVPVANGAAMQVGSQLTVAVLGDELTSTIILQDGRGDVAVSWNGSGFHFFTGVSSIQVNAQAMTNAVVLASTAPLQTPEQVTLNLVGFINTLLQHLPEGGAASTVATALPTQVVHF